MSSIKSLYIALSCGSRAALNHKSSSFHGQGFRLCRSFVHMSPIRMMPEGPEVRTVVDQLQGGVGNRLVDIQFLSGRYVRHGRPKGFEEMAKTMTPYFHSPNPSPEAIDRVQEWNTKGKFIYMVLDDGKNPPDEKDFCRSIWITLGMTGQFVNEKVHQQDQRFARWYLELLDVNSGTFRKVYYHDQRNFGTLKFSLSKEELEKKLNSLGPDVLNKETTIDDFLDRMSSTKEEQNICVFLMDQAKISGVGNYILSESLYRANLDPFASLNELDDTMRRTLFQEIKAVCQESYNSQGLTRPDGGTFRGIEGDPGLFELQCYGRKECVRGRPVIRDTNGPHKRAIWFVQDQLFKPLSERRIGVNTDISSQTTSKELDSTNTNESSNPTKTLETSSSGYNLITALTDPGWREVLTNFMSSEAFQKLETFLEEERASGETIYPPQNEIFSALNLCPFDKTKVVIVGQDPYHGPGQGHGLAFSVQKGITTPPSLRNIIQEAMNDVDIQQPNHGNLEHWAEQGVLMLNTVLTVRRGQANSHSKMGWEEFTDEIIQTLNSNNKGLVFLMWGNPAKKKASGVDESKHVLIQTSHPSPLGATKTSSPFLGSRCFSRANEALIEMGQTPIDWSIL